MRCLLPFLLLSGCLQGTAVVDQRAVLDDPGRGTPVTPVAPTLNDLDPEPPAATPAALDFEGPWETIATCGTGRLLATNGSLWMAVDARVSLDAWVLAGMPFEVEQSVGGGGATLYFFEEPATASDHCGTIEEHAGEVVPNWRGVAGSLVVTFLPDRPFTFEEASAFDLEYGTLYLQMQGVQLVRGNEGEGGLVPSPDLEFVGRLVLLDVPA